jgi:hypothetical protein
MITSNAKVYTTMGQDRMDQIHDAVGAIVHFACRPFGVNVQPFDLILASVEDNGASMTRFEYKVDGRRLLVVDHEAGFLTVLLVRPNGMGVKFINVARVAV